MVGRTAIRSGSLAVFIERDDPAAADYFVFVVEDGGLAGGDGALGFVEECVNRVVIDAGEGGHGRGVAMANLGGYADGFAFGKAGDGDPVEPVRVQVARVEVLVRAYG